MIKPGMAGDKTDWGGWDTPVAQGGWVRWDRADTK